VRLWVRLSALVLLPVLALGAVGVADAAARARAAGRAAAIERGVAELVSAVKLGYWLTQERVPLQASLEVRSAGLTLAQASSLIGVDLARQDVEARHEVDALQRGFGNATWLREPADIVDRVRQKQDAGRLSAFDLQEFERAQELVQRHALALAADLERRAQQLEDGSSVTVDTRVLVLSYRALLRQSDVMASLAAVLWPTGTSRPDPVDLAQQKARYDQVTDDLGAIIDGPQAQAWRELTDSAAFQGFFGTVSAALRGDPDVSLGAIGKVFRSGLDVAAGEYRLVRMASDSVTSEVVHLREAATRSFRAALLGSFGLGLTVMLGAGWLARGVTRPLHGLARRARQVSDGDLDVEPAKPGGPREIADVAGAFDTMVEHLRLVEEQAEALADGDLQHESLRRRAPGRLGRSLQQSVTRLSQSLVAREELENRLSHEATHDGLTGLLNRSAAMVALDQGVARAHRVGSGLAVMVVDLDGLKRVNETAGHPAGDQALRRSATRLSATVRGGDVVARLGADEFVVLAEVDSIDTAVALGERIVRAVSQEAADGEGGAHGGPATTVGASVGIALTLDGRALPATLLHDADVAVRRAKEHGGDRVEVFDDDLRQRLARRAQIEVALTAALAQGVLRLHYQPIVDVDGGLRGLEVLCRWTDTVLGPVSPEVFIDVAESTGLILDLDRWVLAEATRQLARWHADGRMDGVYLSVNVSGRHLLEPAVVADVQQALADSGVDPRLLVLEITETVLLSDLLVAAENLVALRGLGVRIAVDDFGTGYTSIAHLQRLPVDMVKIDRSFVADLGAERGRSLVQLMVDMARTLGLGLVAEGVETDGELNRLREMGCPHVQGYLMARPMPAQDVADWMGTASLA
jgi:diguanylate cyclase (GGDEF)-like protein